MIEKLIVIFIFLGVSLGLNAQQEIGTYFFQGLHQSAALNPAFDAGTKTIIGLPSGFAMFHQNGYSIRSILKGQIYDLVGTKKNQMLIGGEISLLKVSVKSKSLRYNFAHNYKVFSDLQLTNPLLFLITNGNASVIGGKINFSPNWNYNLYSETLFGVSFSGPLSWGANFKILNGIQNISTDQSSFELKVNDDIYQLELNSSFILNSSFPIDFSKLKETKLLSFDLFPNNFGVALDFGVSYTYDKFNFSASVLDIGYMRWNEQVHNYKSESKIVFEGVEISDLIGQDFRFLDTLGQIFDFISTEGSYRKFIPTKFYSNINYHLNDKYVVGALFYGHSSYGKFNSAFSLNLQRHWQKNHGFSVQYSVIDRNFLNIGLSGFTSLGPIQLYGTFDNVLGFLNVLGSENVNARIGLNLIFGKELKQPNLKV